MLNTFRLLLSSIEAHIMLVFIMWHTRAINLLRLLYIESTTALYWIRSRNIFGLNFRSVASSPPRPSSLSFSCCVAILVLKLKKNRYLFFGQVEWGRYILLTTPYRLTGVAEFIMIYISKSFIHSDRVNFSNQFPSAICHRTSLRIRLYCFRGLLAVDRKQAIPELKLIQLRVAFLKRTI